MVRCVDGLLSEEITKLNVDENRDMLLAVVDGDGESDHFGKDHRAPRPGFDRFLALFCDCSLDLFDQVCVDEWALFD